MKRKLVGGFDVKPGDVIDWRRGDDCYLIGSLASEDAEDLLEQDHPAQGDECQRYG